MDAAAEGDHQILLNILLFCRDLTAIRTAITTGSIVSLYALRLHSFHREWPDSMPNRPPNQSSRYTGKQDAESLSVQAKARIS